MRIREEEGEIDEKIKPFEVREREEVGRREGEKVRDKPSHEDDAIGDDEEEEETEEIMFPDGVVDRRGEIRRPRFDEVIEDDTIERERDEDRNVEGDVKWIEVTEEGNRE